MRKGMFALGAVGLLAAGSIAACGDDTTSDSGSSGGSAVGKVGVILPDTSSSQRWGTDDPKFLKAAFDAAPRCVRSPEPLSAPPRPAPFPCAVAALE